MRCLGTAGRSHIEIKRNNRQTFFFFLFGNVHSDRYLYQHSTVALNDKLNDHLCHKRLCTNQHYQRLHLNVRTVSGLFPLCHNPDEFFSIKPVFKAAIVIFRALF